MAKRVEKKQATPVAKKLATPKVPPHVKARKAAFQAAKQAAPTAEHDIAEQVAPTRADAATAIDAQTGSEASPPVIRPELGDRVPHPMHVTETVSVAGYGKMHPPLED